MALRILALFALLLFPGAAFAAAANFQELAKIVAGIVGTATGTLIIFGLVAYFYGMGVNLLEIGEEEGWGEKKKGYFFWGIIILFVMVSIFGIVQIVQNTLFGGDATHPTNGTPTQSLCQQSGSC